MQTIKIAMISDLHGNQVHIPKCDILISCGDNGGNPVDFHKWLNEQPARHVISVQGNHDDWGKYVFEEIKRSLENVAPRVHFMAEGALEIEGIKIYCSSGTPSTYEWARRKNDPIKPPWSRIPDDTEILITHEPPYGILDFSALTPSHHMGSLGLLMRITKLKSLRLHVFGHNHISSGEYDGGGAHFVNASICDANREPVNPVREFVFLPQKNERKHSRNLRTAAPIVS